VGQTPEAVRTLADRGRLLARTIATAPIELYRRLLSPALPRRCKYEPTCSAYALEAVRSFGVLKGIVLAAWRLVRCNPFSHGGYDPVEAQGIFRGRSKPAKETAEAGI
jgi:putative membrane protein insertion efficiency factor